MESTLMASQDVPRLLSGRPVIPPLTARQEQVLRWLIDYSETKGHFPTMRETAERFEVTLARVQALIGQLEKHGYLTRIPGRARNIVLTAVAQEWLTRLQEREGDQQGDLGLVPRKN